MSPDTDEMRGAIEEYGCTLIIPPSDASDFVDAIQVEECQSPTWSVQIPLWTKEEGRSDLSVELTIVETDGIPAVELDDIHVL